MGNRGNVALVLLMGLFVMPGGFALAHTRGGEGEALAAREVAQYEREVTHLEGVLERLRERIEERLNKHRERLCERLVRLKERYPGVTLPPYCAETPPPVAPGLTFTASPTQLIAGATSTLMWATTHAASCLASGGWSGSRATSGSLVVAPAATTTYTLACSGAGGTTTGSVTVGVTSAPSPMSPTVDLTATLTSILQGSSTELAWTSTHATTCVASDGWFGARATSGLELVAPSATTTYTLTCGNGSASSTDSVTVYVAIPVSVPQPTVDLSAASTTLPEGASTSLAWTTTDASTCLASDGWNGARATSGSEVVSPTATTTYVLTCGNGLATSSDSVTINVLPAAVPAPTVDLSTASTTLMQGATTTLTWTSTNATACVASDGWSGARATSGSEVVSPSATTTYILSCGNGFASSSDSATVYVTLPAPIPQPSIDLSAVSTTLVQGASTTLAWTTTNADTCSASGGWSGLRAVSGSEVVSPSATTTYTLTCGNGLATSSDSVTVQVSVPYGVDGVVLSEVVADPAGTDTDREWVEIYNGTGASVDLNGWKIAEPSATDTLATSSTVLQSHGFAVVVSSSTVASELALPGGTVVLVISGLIGDGLTNTGDGLMLLNAASTTVDAVSWGTNIEAFDPAAPAAGSGQSLSRHLGMPDTSTAADWFVTSTTTPGTASL